MLPKPPTCQGCPLYGDGRGFVPDELVDAPVLVLAQNPGADEEAGRELQPDGTYRASRPRPLIGRTGLDTTREMFPLAGLERGQVSLANVLKCRLQGHCQKRCNHLPSERVLRQAVEHCTAAHLRIPASTRLIVAMGALAWRACHGPDTVSAWRGFLHPEGIQVDGRRVDVLATLHTADLYPNPRMRLPVQMDWHKVRRYLAGTWPAAVPPYRLAEAEEVAEMEGWFTEAARAPFVVLDTEYASETRYPLLVGLRARGMEVSLLFDWRAEHPSWFRGCFLKGLRTLARSTRFVFQNYLADGLVLSRYFDLEYADFMGIDDTMQAHAVLWSEWPHDLDFLASIYSPYPRLKHLMADDLYLYNHGDLLATEAAWLALERELRGDPAVERIYRQQNLRLLPVIHERDRLGIRVNGPRVEAAREQYEARQVEAARLARAWVGWPINLASHSQLVRYCYGLRGYPTQKDKDSRRPTVDADAVAFLRGRIAPIPDLEREEKEGLTPAEALDRSLRGADPVLEARVIYAAAQQVLSHYIAPCYDEGGKLRARIYPQQKIHAQASGRWSTTDPPLAQLPSDLRDIIAPDPGEVWIIFDWDQIELRLNAALTNDAPSLRAFAEGADIHTLNACDLFGLPHPPDPTDPHAAEVNAPWRAEVQWEGKDDPRRVFAKRFVYRLDYGGEPRFAGDIPGAKVLGLTPQRLVAAAQRYLAAHPAKAAARRKLAADATRLRAIRDFMGRRRTLLGDARKAVREAFNHPMQGGVASIFNATVVAAKEALPWLKWVYGMHDSQTWACPADKVEQALTVLRQLVCREWTINGITVTFPATFKLREG